MLCRASLLLPQAIPTLLSVTMGHSYMVLDYSLLLLSIILPHPPFPLGSLRLSPLSMYLVLFCSLVYFVQLIPLISKTIWYLSFTAWLISLSIIVSSCIMLSQRIGIPSSFFLLHSILFCKCIHFPFIYLWALRLFPSLGY